MAEAMVGPEVGEQRHLRAVPEMPVEQLFATEVHPPRTAHIGGAAVKYTVEEPETIIDEVPLVFIQGFMGPELVYQDMRHATAQRGRVSVTIGRAGFQHPKATFSLNHLLAPQRLTSQSPYAVIKELGYDKVDAVCHSMGGPIGANLADRKPERFRSLILLGSAGLTGHSVFSLAQRLPYAAAEITRGMPELIRRYGLSSAHAMADYFYRNPLRPPFEALDVSRQDIRQTIPRLEEEHGVRVGVGAFVKDCFFDEQIMRDEVGATVSHFVDIEAELAGHIAPQLQPEIVGSAVMHIGTKINS